MTREPGRARIGVTPGAGPDRGSGTVLVLAAAMVVVAVAAGLLAAGRVLGLRARAVTAADLAALAGADRALEGQGPACEAAERIAASNGARLTACRLDGAEVEVVVEVPLPGLTAALGPVRVTARAGPGPPGGSVAGFPGTPPTHPWRTP